MIALFANVAVGPHLAVANGIPAIALESDPLPADLQASFEKCDKPIFLGSEIFDLTNKLLTTGCKIEHRLLARLSRVPEFNRSTFTCPVIVTLNRRDLPVASIGYTTPSRCDLAGQKIEKALMMALIPTRFDPLDIDIGDYATFRVDLRVGAARGTIPAPSSVVTFLRQDEMDLQANSRVITFANKDKLQPFPPPPAPGSGPGASGGPAPDTSGFAKAWQLQIGKQAADAIRNSKALDERLRRQPWSVTARFMIGGDQTVNAVDVMSVAGAAADEIAAIQAALQTINRVEPVPDQPATVSFLGPVTLAIRNR